MLRTRPKGTLALAYLALSCFPGPAGAADDRTVRTAQATAPSQDTHDASPHAGHRGTPAAALPPALPEAIAAPTGPRSPAPLPTALGTARPVNGPGMADFERIALERNPTLRQAFAQFDAARSRSFQAGLYPETGTNRGLISRLGFRYASPDHGRSDHAPGLPAPCLDPADQPHDLAAAPGAQR